MKWFLRILLTSLGLALAGLSGAAVINRYVHSQTAGRIQNSITEIPLDPAARPVAVVFGARVRQGDELSHTLADRVLTGVELYRAGRVKKLLMSGDRQSDEYDEPAAMKKYAVALGVPESDIVLDNDGKRTYDTCWRAREIFGIRQAILVTQDYHQPRAVYLCRSLGVESVGLTANRRAYVREDFFRRREFFAIAGAWFEINLYSFEPAGGEPRPIEP